MLFFTVQKSTGFGVEAGPSVCCVEAVVSADVGGDVLVLVLAAVLVVVLAAVLAVEEEVDSTAVVLAVEVELSGSDRSMSSCVTA